MKGYYEQSEFEQSSLLITCIESSLVKDGHIVHPHWHDHMEILYVKSGQALQQVDNVYELIEEGDVVIIGSNQTHGTHPYNGSSADIRVFQIKIMEIVNDHTSYSQVAMEAMSGGLAIDMPVADLQQVIINDLEKIMAYEGSMNLSIYYEQKGLLLTFMAKLLKKYPMKIEQEKMMFTSKAREALGRFFNHLNTHYAEDMDVNEASALAGYSKAQFNRLLKMSTGYSYVEYMNRTRIDAAIGKMIEGYGITDSATMSGFSAISSFNRYFKRYKNCSPREYMKKYM